MNPIAHAQMDNGIITEFVNLVTTLVKLVQHPPLLVPVAQMEVTELYKKITLVHVTKDGSIMVLKFVENV